MSRFAEMLGELLICQFPLAPGGEGKVRPARVWFHRQQDAFICRANSMLWAGQRDSTRPDSRTAALSKSPENGLDRIGAAAQAIALRHLGVLFSADTAAIHSVWNQHLAPEPWSSAALQ